MSNDANALKRKEQIKKILVYGGMVMLCLVSFYFIFKPSKEQVQAEQQKVGFNAELPDPRGAGIEADKIAAYELEDMRVKQEQKMRTLEDFTAMTTDDEEDLGSALCTLGTVLPAFVVMILITTILRHFIEHPRVRAILAAIVPCVTGIILATGLWMLLELLLPALPASLAGFDLSALIVGAILILAMWGFKLLILWSYHTFSCICPGNTTHICRMSLV